MVEDKEVKYYSSIIDLPLNKFIEARVDGNLQALVIKGEPTKVQLNEAWMDISQEYSDALGDQDHKMYLALLKEVTNLAVNYQKLQKIIPYLMTIPFQALEITGELEETVEVIQIFFNDINKILKTNFRFDHTNPEQYQKELDRCFKMSASIKMRFDIKQSEFDAVKPKHEQGQPVTKEYFYSILNTLEDHSKITITDTITVYRFCDRIRKYNQYCEREAAKARNVK